MKTVYLIIVVIMMSLSLSKKKRHSKKKQVFMGDGMVVNQPRAVIQPAINYVSTQYEHSLEPVLEEHHVIEPIRLVTPEFAKPKEHLVSEGHQIQRQAIQSVENQHRYYDAVDPYTGIVQRHEQIVQRPITRFVDTVHSVEQHHIRNLDGSPVGQKVIAYHGLDKRKKRKL